MRNSLFICLRRTGTGLYAKTQQCVSQHNGRVNFILADCLYKNKKVLCLLRNKKPPVKGGFYWRTREDSPLAPTPARGAQAACCRHRRRQLAFESSIYVTQ